MSDVQAVNGRQFIRRARRWANAKGHAMVVDKSRGNGGHQIVWINARRTTVKTGEIGKGLLAEMLDQLAVSRDEF